MTLDALKARLKELETVPERALPAAAKAVQDEIRSDIKTSRRAAQGRRKTERARRKSVGDKRRVSMGRALSGIPVRAVVAGSAVVISASSQVHHLAREQSEIDGWLEVFGDEVREAAKPGKGGR